MRRLTIFVSATALVILGLAGCGLKSSGSITPPPTGPVPGADPSGPAAGGARSELTGQLLVYVPCGIAGPYGEIKKLFEARHPGLKVTQEVANIDVQANLILDGKGKPDVWLALGDREIERIKKAGLVEGEPVTYAYNSLALLVANQNPCGIESVAGLASPKVKTIAMADEDNSSGYYARRALERAGVWDQVQGKLWLTDQPAKIKTQLSSGKADVGFVYYPCTRETRTVGGKPQEMKGKLQLLGKIPAELAGSFPAQAAVIKGCANPQAARAFLEFLLTDEAQDIWEKWAFDRVKKPASGQRITLYMYCGAGIRPFMDQAIEAYRKLRPSVRIDVGYAGSGCLLSQLTFAKRGDLYMPGEDFYLNQAAERGYIVSQKLFGYFEPVLLVQKGNPKRITTVADLARPGIKVGVGEPEAAAVGRAAEATFRKANLYEAIERNIVFRAGNVPELGNAVKLKSLDVAFVWNVTAAQLTADCDAVAIPRNLYEPSRIPIGVLKFSEHPQEAQAFVDWCVGPQGQKLAAETGITPVMKGVAEG